MENYLASIYYDPKHPASYSGAAKLYKIARSDGKKITHKQIREWLKNQETYTLHRHVNWKFPRNRVIVGGYMQQWDADLMDMTSLAKHNGGVTYILVTIDIFSRYLFVQPLKSKHGKEVVKAFANIFAKGHQPFKIRTDKGTEFTNRTVQQFFRKNGVEHFVTQNEPKANYAERVIKTLKRRIYMYFTKKQTNEYVSHLQDFADSYNSSPHRSIKMKPSDVNYSNEAELWEQQYGTPSLLEPVKKFKFSIHDHVRISFTRTTFMREYNEKWTGEIFTVVNRFVRDGIPVYKLQDYSGEEIQGTFYQDELQSVVMPDVFRIEKIPRRRKVKGEKQSLVRWAGWPSKYDSWIQDRYLDNYA